MTAIEDERALTDKAFGFYDLVKYVLSVYASNTFVYLSVSLSLCVCVFACVHVCVCVRVSRISIYLFHSM